MIQPVGRLHRKDFMRQGSAGDDQDTALAGRFRPAGGKRSIRRHVNFTAVP